DVFAGSEVFLLDNMRGGGKGCITATGNINPAAIDEVFRNWKAANANALQAGITATRNVMQKYPMMAALKAVIAHYARDPEGPTRPPPLARPTAAQTKWLAAGPEARGFDMPRLAEATATA